MSLPKIEHPIYDVTLPSSKKKVSFRPYLMKEEKIMLMAVESRDEKEMLNAVRQILNNCVIDKNFDVDETPIFDTEWLLINLRMRSVGNDLSLDYTCRETYQGEECGEPFNEKIQLDQVEKLNELEQTKLKKEIEIPGTKFMLKMRYPRFKSSASDSYGLLTEVVEAVWDGKEYQPLSENSEEEVNEFFDSLTKDQFSVIQDWLVKLPKFEVNRTHKCAKCGFEHILKIDNLASFF